MSGSPPALVVEAARHRRVEIVASLPVAEELKRVMRRPKFAVHGVAEQDVEDVLELLTPYVPPIEIDAPIRDPDDAPFVAAAVMGHAEAIITGDRDFLDDADLRAWLAERGIEVLTPAQAIERLEP